ncbi:MarR family winged helix-turn-helix transcriptional regulator [Euzebya pacifica]|uniref:MarR family winged helix-turn-helix transcriptional regulator n=1 Tax=Euzebya pacifica TaxID=1608957 RepID=UPI000DF7BD9D|nr:MarR family transcriptional regulator [Euzebya pacifica]
MSSTPSDEPNPVLTGTYDGGDEPPTLALAELFFTNVTDRFLAGLEAAGYPQSLAKSRLLGMIPPDGVHLTALAERCRVTKQSCGQMVTELEEEGYLERVPDPRDGRAKLIRWGPVGRESAPHAYASMRAIDDRIAAILGEEDARTLRRLLLRVAAAEGLPDRAGSA